MKQAIVILGIVLCLNVLQTSQAQNLPEVFVPGDGWVYQQQCLTNPIAPPDNWSWDGTILLWGPYGIHGYNQIWDTTRVLAFIQDDYSFSISISPDGMWLIRIVGERECGGGMGCSYTYNHAHELQAYYLASNQSRNGYSIAWNFTELSHHTLRDVARPTWINNREFVYGSQTSSGGMSLSLVNVETRAISVWTGRNDIMMPRTISPDLSRGFDYENILNLETGEILGNLEEDRGNISIYPYESGQVWSPNSAYFLAIKDLGENQEQLLLYSRDGQYLEHILTASRLRIFPEADKIKWSPDAQKFLFQTWIPIENGYDLSTTHIVDIQQHTVTDLCYDLDSRIAWSPGGEYLALNWDSQISILDSDSNHYLIQEQASGYHVLGWRTNE